jgi:hypothetical protein
MIRTGDFPPGVKITKQRVGWRESIVDTWIRERPTTSTGSRGRNVRSADVVRQLCEATKSS